MLINRANRIISFLSRPSEGWDPVLLKKKSYNKLCKKEERPGSQPSLGRLTVGIAFLLFLLVFFTLGIPFTQWWFYGADDAHALMLAYKTTTWKQLFYFFYDGHVNQGQAGPSNFVSFDGRTGFLSTYYRPLCLVLYTWFYWIFGNNGYAFHLINVGAHALNTSLIFLILRCVTTSPWAALSALLFAFHPQIAFRFGAFVNMQYYLSLTGMLTIIILLKNYIDTDKHRYLLLACLVYIPLLFLRETAIVLPFMMIIGIWLYKRDPMVRDTSFLTTNGSGKSTLSTPLALSLSKGFSGFKTAIPFFFIMFSFLSLRLWLYPFTPTSAKCSSMSAFLSTFIAKKIPEVQLFLYDLFHLSWFPWGHPKLRIMVMFFFFSVVIWLFARNTKKLYVCAAAFTGMCMLWPAVLGPYSPRYFYEAYIFMLITMTLLFSWQKKSWSSLQKIIGLLILSIIIIIHMVFCVINFNRRQQKMHILHHAIEELTHNKAIISSTRPLCFMGHPFDGLSNQNAQLFWVMLNDWSRKIYFDSATALISPHANVITSTRWGTISSNYPTHDAYTVDRIKHGFIFTSHDPDEIYFCLMNHGFSLGEKIIHQQALTKTGYRVVTQFSLLLKQEYLDEHPIYISWSFSHQAFLVIEDGYIHDTDKT